MLNRSPIFAQIIAGLDPTEFKRCATRFPSLRRPRALSAFDQFLALSYAHLTRRESLREIVVCLRTPRAYHAGFRSRITRTNLAYACAHRDWRVFMAVAEILMRRVRRLYQDEPALLDLPEVAYALDSSIIELSLALHPWSRRQRTEGAVKLHTLLCLRTRAPSWNLVSEGRLPDQKSLDDVPLEPGAYYVMDRGYLDFTRLVRWEREGAFFVVRSKSHVRFSVCRSRPVDKSTGLRCDQIVRLSSPWSKKVYPSKLRRVRLYVEKDKYTLVLLTNDLESPVRVIGELYHRRWQVELFFRWIKQHLRLRGFYGRSPNAVKSQVWCAICTFLLVLIAHKRLNLPGSVLELTQIASVAAFEQLPLAQLVGEIESVTRETRNYNQLQFNDI